MPHAELKNPAQNQHILALSESVLTRIHAPMQKLSTQPKVLTAANLDVASEFLHTQPCDLLVADLKESDPEHIQFMLEARSEIQDLPMLIFSERHRFPSAWAGRSRLRFVDHDDVANTELSLRATLDQAQSTSPIRKTAELLCLLASTEATGTLVVNSDDGMGLVWFENGQLAGAETSDHTGPLALATLVSWPHARYLFEDGAFAPTNLKTDLSSFLFGKELRLDSLPHDFESLRMVEGWVGSGVGHVHDMESLVVDTVAEKKSTITDLLHRLELLSLAERMGAPPDQIAEERITVYPTSYVIAHSQISAGLVWYLVINRAEGNLAMARIKLKDMIRKATFSPSDFDAA